MFKDEGSILQAAAILAATQHATNVKEAPHDKPYRDSSVDVLLNILREMERKKLIPPGLAPK